MCLTFDVRQSGKEIVDHLVNMFPLVYDIHISDRLKSMLPNLDNLKARASRRRNKGASKLAQKISTRAGQGLYLFAKSADFGRDLYSDWIENELKSSLYVATWRRGSGTPLNSTCPRDAYHVNNVQDFKVEKASQKLIWNYLQDHSKWAISDEGQLGYVCISDINRMESQFKRGGGAVCIRCGECWSVFSKTILDVESCPNRLKLDSRFKRKPKQRGFNHWMSQDS